MCRYHTESQRAAGETAKFAQAASNGRVSRAGSNRSIVAVLRPNTAIAPSAPAHTSRREASAHDHGVALAREPETRREIVAGFTPGVTVPALASRLSGGSGASAARAMLGV